ncbi:uncharacterized protein LY89DRAFT_726555 [Mollisia scopiformis]|uniref:Uncharacterized protein n=1 Tax=Mollisia scopiformis TaxID=149040 RepID=A0A132B373_MOLSC|nr:uncharacterized protein LY89DRAFT_726555 [Mollisia scopiformis]KUJ06364.1 hypothetical protein LY89DRAFT_726555 [Mollisia scopiformis]
MPCKTNTWRGLTWLSMVGLLLTASNLTNKQALFIASNFTGACSLDPISSISDGIAIYNVDTQSPNSAPYLTSINADMLNNIGTAGFSGFDSVPMLRYISMSGLVSIGSLELHVGPANVDLQFPSLSSAESIFLTGNINNTNFDKLITVTNDLTIAPTVPLADGSASALEYANINWQTFNLMSLTFPVLQNTTSFYAVGNFTSIDAPRLATIAGAGVGNPQSTGLTIAANGTPLGFDFPALQNVTQVSLFGTISDFSFPRLERIDGDFSFRGSPIPTNVNLTALNNVSSIVLDGNIASYSFPSLRYIEHDLIINSEGLLDCDPAMNTWSSATHLSDDPVLNITYSCQGSGGSNSGKAALTSGTIIGIAIGCATITIGAMVLAGLYQRRKRKFEPKVAAPAYEHELNQRTWRRGSRGEDGLPEYAPPVPPRDGVRRGNVTSWGGVTAVETLPGYEP